MKQTPATAQISPLTWKQSGAQILLHNNSVVGWCEPWINEDQDKVNAAFIVLACNNHTRLVEALKDLLPMALQGLRFPYDTAKNKQLFKSVEILLASLEQA